MFDEEDDGDESEEIEIVGVAKSPSPDPPKPNAGDWQALMSEAQKCTNYYSDIVNEYDDDGASLLVEPTTADTNAPTSKTTVVAPSDGVKTTLNQTSNTSQCTTSSTPTKTSPSTAESSDSKAPPPAGEVSSLTAAVAKLSLSPQPTTEKSPEEPTSNVTQATTSTESTPQPPEPQQKAPISSEKPIDSNLTIPHNTQQPLTTAPQQQTNTKTTGNILPSTGLPSVNPQSSPVTAPASPSTTSPVALPPIITQPPTQPLTSKPTSTSTPAASITPPTTSISSAAIQHTSITTSHPTSTTTTATTSTKSTATASSSTTSTTGKGVVLYACEGCKWCPFFKKPPQQNLNHGTMTGTSDSCVCATCGCELIHHISPNDDLSDAEEWDDDKEEDDEQEQLEDDESDDDDE
ncbi:hypothetical protein Pelo_7418 [Pelomyxa schiedti]|nr:hypothetical protein Pelo_7418 [Pelomyxa schiedti]